MKQKTESLQVRFTEPEYHEGTKHIFLMREDLPDSWWQHSFIISKGKQNWAIVRRKKNEGEYFNEAMYKGTLTECKKYMRQMVIRVKHDERYNQINRIKEAEAIKNITKETAEERMNAVIKKYDFDYYGNRIKDNPILAKMAIPPEGDLDNLIKKPEDFLRIIRITDTDDLKRCVKYLAENYPDKYGKDSVKIAGEIMKNAGDHSFKNIQNSLKEAGCTTPEKTRQILDKWAGFNSGQKLEKPVCEGMGR